MISRVIGKWIMLFKNIKEERHASRIVCQLGRVVTVCDGIVQENEFVSYFCLA